VLTFAKNLINAKRFTQKKMVTARSPAHAHLPLPRTVELRFLPLAVLNGYPVSTVQRATAKFGFQRRF
jgi:hypothetical protein